MSHKLKDKKMTWKLIQKIARLQDVQMEKDEQTDDQEVHDEIVINLEKKVPFIGEGADCKKFRDAATQEDENVVQKNKVYYADQSKYNSQKPNYTHINGNSNSNYQQNFNRQESKAHSNNNNNMQYNNHHYQTWTFRRPPENLWNNVLQCDYCQRLGHTSGNCRSRWNTCYRCGSVDHHFRQCPGLASKRFDNENNRFDGNRVGFNSYRGGGVNNRGGNSNDRGGGSYNNRGGGTNNFYGFDGRGSYRTSQGSDHNRSASQPPPQGRNSNQYQENVNNRTNRRNSNENYTGNARNLN